MTNAKLTIYHNPNCSKSRETLDILTSNDRRPEIVEYLIEPPTKEVLEGIVKLLNISPAELVRTGEPAYEQAGLNIDTMSEDQIIDAICAHPSLLQRPIVVSGNKAIIGRPPSRVLDII
ncbi:MAG: arsenate reductase (glutaredoxin) [Gammaproteobacteria bacterium]|nr:arsenate reductase (glutaredoxin) [Gammaproteobacteria bacterium]